jgi:hypothetical protein
MSGEVTIKFQGDCFLCGKNGHRKSECWDNPAAAKAKAKPKKGKGKGKQNQGGSPPASFSGQCSHCGIVGHKKAECRTLKAEQGAGGSGGQNPAKRQRTDISALEEQLAAMTIAVTSLKGEQEVGSVTMI